MNWLQKLFNFREKRHLRPDVAGTVEEESGDVVKPFLEHLEDLRGTLFKMAICLVAGMIIAFTFIDKLIALLKAPAEHVGIRLISLDSVGPFMLTIKMAFYAGIVLSFPFLLWFAAEFVLPALTRREKRLLIPGVFIGAVLFAFGVYVSYSFVVPKTVQWLVHYNTKVGIDTTQVDALNHFKLVTHLSIACGLLCELPLLMIALSLLGIVSYRLLANTRSYAVTLMLILVAIISPTPDPLTFLTLALPVIAIYEICIWIVWLIEKRRA